MAVTITVRQVHVIVAACLVAVGVCAFFLCSSLCPVAAKLILRPGSSPSMVVGAFVARPQPPHPPPPFLPQRLRPHCSSSCPVTVILESAHLRARRDTAALSLPGRLAHRSDCFRPTGMTHKCRMWWWASSMPKVQISL
jgi:hypothetical protein